MSPDDCPVLSGLAAVARTRPLEWAGPAAVEHADEFAAAERTETVVAQRIFVAVVLAPWAQLVGSVETAWLEYAERWEQPVWVWLLSESEWSV